MKNIYFLGIGGIGMSALARYFNSNGYKVAGYDRSASALTHQLESEGINIHYTDGIENIPDGFLDPEQTMVVFTPAVPSSLSEFLYFKSNGFKLYKRAQILGEITKSMKSVCVAGTHGKTTTSTMTAHLLHNSAKDCNAFLGGISRNFDQNLIISKKSNLVVVEADEYDHSFLSLSPSLAIITAVDADHLDVYGTEAEYRRGFEDFTSLIRPGGTLIMRKGLPIKPRVDDSVTILTYSIEEGDFHAENIRSLGGDLIFDFVSPNGVIKDIKLGVPVRINIENGIAAMAAAMMCGATEDELRIAMASYRGVKRRFDFHIKRNDIVLIDDYAHHPKEVRTCIESVRLLYKDKRICGIFQPHLYTRTRDFADDFATSLSLLDQVVLLDIYPAREKPIEGITSKIILDKINVSDKRLCSKAELLDFVKSHDFEVLLTIGAGDIDLMIPDLKKILLEKTDEKRVD